MFKIALFQNVQVSNSIANFNDIINEKLVIVVNSFTMAEEYR